jgi:hypothetical protein
LRYFLATKPRYAAYTAIGRQAGALRVQLAAGAPEEVGEL